MKYVYTDDIGTEFVFKTKDALINHVVYDVIGNKWRKEE